MRTNRGARPACKSTQLMILLLLCALPAGIQYYRLAQGNKPPLNVQPRSVVYELQGEVKRPGIYRYTEEQTLAALSTACGALHAQKNSSLKTTAGNTRLTFSESGTATADLDAAVLLSYYLPITLAAATAHDLELIQGIGPKTARAIIDYRKNAGPIDYIMQLIEVKGIGPKTLKKIVRYLKP